MVTMKKFIITIGRQYGCGAHEIVTKLSEKLGVSYYDKEIIKRAAKESGFDENLFKFYDERPTTSFLYNISADGFSAVGSPSLTLEDRVVQYQFDAIRKVADEESCIIVGRCSDYILKDTPGVVRVFIHGDDEYRINRVTKLYGLSQKDAVKEIKNIDKKRAKFHNFYSDEKWGDSFAYDLCINVSKTGLDGAVDLIEYYIRKNFA